MRSPNEGVDVATNTPAAVGAHFNDLLGGQIGIDNIGTGSVIGQENWWGCAGGPGATGCTTVSGTNVLFTPFLTAPF
jgi:hypothetical protein